MSNPFLFSPPSPNLSSIPVNRQSNAQSTSRIGDVFRRWRSRKVKEFEDLDELFQSRTIKFIVGPEKKEYTVHEASFADLSPALRVLLMGGFQESSEGKVIWDETDPVTFMLLVQYAYDGDYSLPEPPDVPMLVAANESTEPMPEEDTEVLIEIDMFGRKESKDLPPSMCDYIRNPLHNGSRHSFAKQHFSGAQWLTRSLRFCTCPRPDSSHYWEKLKECCFSVEYLQHMYSEHVKLYFLADKYAIDDLKSLCLDKVRDFLLHCPRTGELMGVVVDSIPLIYPWTVPGDRLRQMLVRFLVIYMSTLETCTTFKEIRRNIPEFAVDLLDEIPRDYWRELRDGAGFKPKDL